MVTSYEVVPLETYTQEVNHYLKSLPSSIRAEEVRELHSHLEQLTDDLQIGGRSRAEAAQLAIARFGTPSQVGLHLRDVWEGNRGMAATLCLTVGSNWALQSVNFALLCATVYTLVAYNDGLIEALHPLFTAWMWAAVIPAPFAWNFMLGQRDGRRVSGAALLAFAALLVGALLYAGTNTLVTLGALSLPSAPLACVLMGVAAFVGGECGSRSRRQQRWALISGVPREETNLVLRRPLRLRPLRVLGAVSAVLALATGSYIAFKPRSEAVLDDTTPEAAVRAFLRYPGYAYNAGDLRMSVLRVEAKPFTSRDIRQYPPEVKQRFAYTVIFTRESSALQTQRPRINLLEPLLQKADTIAYQRPFSPPTRAWLLGQRAQGDSRPMPSAYVLSGDVTLVDTGAGWVPKASHFSWIPKSER